MGFQESFHSKVTPLGDRAFGRQAVLVRATERSQPFVAVWEDLEHEIEVEQFHYTKWQGRDFMFDKTSPVTAAGVTLTPRGGDQIEIVENGLTKRFEVQPMGTATAVESMEGSFRWRVHSKQVA